MMYVQYSFIDRREPTAFASAPVQMTPTLVVISGILAMIASAAVVAIG
jgi:hypothetical protein